MANSISVTVKKQYGPNGYQLIAAAGTSGTAKLIGVDTIRLVQTYSDPTDVGIYSIVACEATTGTRNDFYCEETTSAVNGLINAALA